jgi:hypothetical protein
MSHPKTQISRIIPRAERTRNSYRMLLCEAVDKGERSCKIMHAHATNLQISEAHSLRFVLYSSSI